MPPIRGRKALDQNKIRIDLFLRLLLGPYATRAMLILSRPSFHLAGLSQGQFPLKRFNCPVGGGKTTPGTQTLTRAY
jgi:hypothetical protein